MKKKSVNDLYMLKRKIQREKRDVRKKALGIEDDHTDTSMQRIYGVATKTRRALKIELFGSKSKASGTKGEETSIEIFVRKFLEEMKVQFTEQKAIEYINVDFYVPALDFAIECCGDYWHCNPRLYPEPKNKIQKKNVEKDKRTREILEKNKKNLLILWENEVKKYPEIVKENLKRILEGEIRNIEESSEWVDV